MTKKLDFVIIGSQKCATTWLYDCLNQHPQLNMRNSKNEDYYYGGEYYQENGGDEWYFAQFEDKPERLYGCVSVEYIEDESVVKKLYDLNPNLKIIASLRQPDLRSISAYQWYVRKAKIPNLPLEDGVANLLEHYRGIKKNEYSENYMNIIERGFYAQRLKRFYNQFPSHQIKIVLFDEINLKPVKIIKSVENFLQIDADFVPTNIKTIPKKNTGNKTLVNLQRTFPKSRIVGKVVDLSNQYLYKSKKDNKSKKLVSDKISDSLKNIFSEPNKELILLLQQNNDENTAQKISSLWK